MAQRVPVLLGLGALSIVRGQFSTAREQAEQALYLAQQAQDAMARAYSHMLLGHALFYFGELDAAHMHLEWSLALYEPQQHHSRSVMLAREDPQVFGLARLASILWYLGYPDQALQWSQAALTVARELGHAYSLVMALIFAAGHYQRRREGDRTRALAEEAIAIAREQGFALRLAEAIGLRGWALAHQGQGEAGIIELRQGLTAERSAGIGTGQPYRLALLADAYGQVGRIEAGLQALEG
jgi:tetratricopeptide (TPR) repeat protein